MLDWVSYRLGDTFMKRYLLIGAICLFGISDCFASGSNSEEIKQMCASLGFTVSSKALCNNKAFPCPRGNWWKCDETAKVGDIKYSSSGTSAGNGWLLADGSVYDEVKYPELYKLIGTNFGGSSTAPTLPNYQGVYLRAAGQVTIKRKDGTSHTLGKTFSSANYKTMQSSYLRKHSHKYCSYSLYYGSACANGAWSEQSDYYTRGSNTTVTSVDAGTGRYVCLDSIAMYPYIYAGQPAK